MTKKEVAACVRCGYCCETAVCPFGVWDVENSRCAYLLYEVDGRTLCGRYEFIMRHPEQHWSPAFQGGCCSSLNSKRHPVITRHHGGKIPTVYVDIRH